LPCVFNNCTNGFTLDDYGCPTCTCNPSSICTKILCNLACPAYVTDSNGCPTCTCVQKPPVCPELACLATCAYGTALSTVANTLGCPTCNCNPCPGVLCSRYCQYGYAKSTTGCQTCDCNTAPVCPMDNTAVATACPLNCTKGLAVSSGCTQCQCNAVIPCTCGAMPTDPPQLCPDGVSYQKYTSVCQINSTTNVCNYFKTLCPIGISVTVSTALTSDQLSAIGTAVGVTNSADITISKVSNANGSVTYTIWVQKDGIPPSSNANTVNNAVETQAKQSDPNASSYVLSDGTPMSFGNILAPVVGLLSVVFLLF